MAKKKKNKLVDDIFTKNLDKLNSFAPERIKTITQKAKPHSSREGRLSVLKREIDPLYEDAEKRAKMSPAPGAYKKGGRAKGPNRPRPTGPHMWVRGDKRKKYASGGVVMAGKKVGCQIK